MRFAAAMARGEDGTALAGELAARVAESVPAPDLALLFFNGDLADQAGELAAALRQSLAPGLLLGCTCEGFIGVGQEVERQPGASLLAGSLPGVALRPFHLAADRWAELLSEPERLQQAVGTGETHRGQLLLGDPFTTPAIELLDPLNRNFPGLPTLGGMASGARRPGENALILGDRIYREGAVGAGLGGALRLDAVVSQGCRPIGEPYVVTKAEQNVILELRGRPALEVLEQFLEALPETDRALLGSGLFVGLVINEYQERFARGDFLVRGVLGAYREAGGLVVGDQVRGGQSIQFHVRDADTATEDLRLLLEPQAALDPPPAGALLFSCNGRGTRMFPEPHHDAGAIARFLPDLPLAGFFAAGELGPVGGRSFLHGHTASLALFRPADDDGV